LEGKPPGGLNYVLSYRLREPGVNTPQEFLPLSF
jgi:hypothetical protein